MKALAIITGASRGIGKAAAAYFASRSYDLALIARNKTLLQANAEELTKKYGIQATCFAVDVAHQQQVQACVEDIKSRYNSIEVLFNSAGILERGTSSLPPDRLKQMLETNLLGIHHFIYEIVPLMKERQKGYIFNLASYAGQRPLARSGAYCMSKYGVVGYSKSLSLELVNDHIKVTAICPSVVDTDMTADFNIPNEEKIFCQDITQTIDYLMQLSPNAYVDEVIIKASYLLKDQ